VENARWSPQRWLNTRRLQCPYILADGKEYQLHLNDRFIVVEVGGGEISSNLVKTSPAGRFAVPLIFSTEAGIANKRNVLLAYPRFSALIVAASPLLGLC